MNSGLVLSNALRLGISRFECWFGDYYDRQYLPPPHGAAEQTRPESPHCWGFMITLSTSHSVGLLWPNDRPGPETSLPDNTQNSQETEIHAPGGIQTRNLSRWAAAYPSLVPRGHWDRLTDTQAYRGFHTFVQSYYRNGVFKKAMFAFFRTLLRCSH